MSVVLITGSAGLIGSEATLFFAGQGFDSHFPNWQLQYDVPAILHEIYEAGVKRWQNQNQTLQKQVFTL